MVEIKTERLVLHPLAMEHAADIAAALSNFEVTKNLSVVPFPYSEADAREWISLHPKFPASDDQKFSIVNEDNAFCGVLGLDIGETGPELGYWLDQKYWGKGYMSEAASAALTWLFANSEVKTVTSGAYTFNPASLAVQYKLGFKDVRTEPRMCLAQGQEFPLVVTSLDRQDFKPL
ncbi:GNAT family N-acetyltransferase [Maritalea sp.]|uniref:GNAT family N-acetyltransferase n=1 Tax=Maritalea sp. TaxID=2003361 RepID=UPI003EF76DF5